ncbi:hypothetical protein PIROE2DRAFT_61341 [Piromyces sp. E2]|nr:hypothetical protein PIROE2DRAFT_61341 [Piromyces sp. E2]|eukprot:OUM63363.1 hypothetical protein PIROE2DRAFT_61341 [Piromyces sp. E2]
MEEDMYSNEMFVKIRSQINSSLENQKEAALVLQAVDQTIREQGQTPNAVAYFAALMTVLDQQKDLDNLNIISAITYLLSIVFPRLPASILKVKFQDISVILSSVLERYQTHAPLARSIISCFECVLIAQDSVIWNSDTAKRIFQVIIILAIDDRPKVRKRAQDAIRKILYNPPPPSVQHPATGTVTDFCIKILKDTVNAPAKRKEKEQQVYHVLGFLKSIIIALALQGGSDRNRHKLSNLVDTLLKLPVVYAGSGNTIITQWVFQVLEVLLLAGKNDNPNVIEQVQLDVKLIDNVIQSLMNIMPNQQDIILTPLWLNLIKQSFLRMAELINEQESNDDMVEDAEMIHQQQQYTYTQHPQLLSNFINTTFPILMNENSKAVIFMNAAECYIDIIKNGMTKPILEQTLIQKETPLTLMINLTGNSLGDVKYRNSWGSILLIIEALFDVLQQDSLPLLEDILLAIMSIRDDTDYNSSFIFKSELDSAIMASVRAIGMENFETLVPLNIEREIPDAPVRPYLLSVFSKALAANQSSSKFGNNSLKFYSVYFLPLAKRLYAKSAEYWKQSKFTESKLFETLATQVWQIFPELCGSMPGDVKQSFHLIVQHLGMILQQPIDKIYPNLASKPELRPLVCAGLQDLINKNYDIINNPKEAVTDEVVWKAKNNLTEIKKYVAKFLATLCNVYTNVPLDILESIKKGNVSAFYEKERLAYEDTIGSCLKIADGNDISAYFKNLVKTLLQSQINNGGNETSKKSPQDLQKTYRLYYILDLMLVFLPHLPEMKEPGVVDENNPVVLYYKVLIGQINDTDSMIQKKTYKSLSTLITNIKEKPEFLRVINIEELIAQLIDPQVIMKLSANSGVKKLRTNTLISAVSAINAEQSEILLQIVPIILSEIILGTKEVNEKTRNTSYDGIVIMGKKMLEIGKLNAQNNMMGEGQSTSTNNSFDMTNLNNDISSIDENNKKGNVNLNEYFMMVVAGLAGSSPHMQAATVGCLSRLLYEFRDDMDKQLIKELLTTVMYFMNSLSREVLKAVLGFVKVAIVCLEPELLEDFVELIITSILSCSKDKKSHFKTKVRHIFERLIRKFSYEVVEGFVPEESKKLIVNIRKRRERAKRKSNTEKKDEENKNKEKTNENYEKTMYDSESDLGSGDEGSEDEDEGMDSYLPDQFKTSNKTKKHDGTWIKESEDAIDFLDPRIVSRVIGTKESNIGGGKRKSKKEAFKRNDSGKMIINDSDEEDNGDNMEEAAEEDYYMQSVKSADRFTRTPSGRVKFNKTQTKRGRSEEDDFMDEDDDYSEEKSNKRGKGENGKIANMLGRNYKAKNAAGDVKKKNQLDPYAYIPLNSKIVGNKRKSAKVAGSFKNIIRAAQKGSAEGHNSARKQRIAQARKGNKKHK